MRILQILSTNFITRRRPEDVGVHLTVRNVLLSRLCQDAKPGVEGEIYYGLVRSRFQLVSICMSLGLLRGKKRQEGGLSRKDQSSQVIMEKYLLRNFQRCVGLHGHAKPTATTTITRLTEVSGPHREYGVINDQRIPQLSLSPGGIAKASVSKEALLRCVCSCEKRTGRYEIHESRC